MTQSIVPSFLRGFACLIAAAILASCESDQETESNIGPDSELGLATLQRTIQVVGGSLNISHQKNRDRWTQAAGQADHALGHAQFSDRPTPLWTFAAGQAMRRGRWTSMEPLIDQGTVYTLSWDQRLSAVDLDTGAAKWQRRLGSKAESDGVFGGGIAIANQVLYAATGAGEFHAIEAATGQVIWTVPLPAPSRSGPLVFQGTLYVTDILGAITAFDQQGNELWQEAAPQSALSILAPNTPAGSDSGLYQVLPSGVVRALLPSGQAAWQSYAGLQGTSGRSIDLIPGTGALPVVDGNFLLISSWANRSVALTANTGEVIWDIPIGSAATPLVTNNHVFLITHDGYMRALQQDTGYQVWSTNLRNQQARNQPPVGGWYGPLLAGGTLIVGSSEGALIFLNPRNGERLHELRVGSPLVAPLSLADETLLVTTRDGLIRAYR